MSKEDSISSIKDLERRVEVLESIANPIDLQSATVIAILQSDDNKMLYSAFFYFDYMINGKGDFGPSEIKSDNDIIKQRMDRLKEWFLDNKGVEVNVNSLLWESIKNREIWLVEQEVKELGYFQDIIDSVYGAVTDEI